MAPFSLNEIHQVVFGMKRNKSPGPDGFPADFYQDFWDLVKWDVKTLVDSFAKWEINIARLNYGIINLVPKTNDAKQIQKFRPICLLNVSFKIITKVGTSMLTHIAHSVVQPSQSAFMPDRNILEGVVVLHETLHEIHTKKLDGAVFKACYRNDHLNLLYLSQNPP